MTVINHRSISGITSITTPAGSDNLLTVHTSDQVEKFRIKPDGIVVSGGSSITGIATASNFKTGTSNLHNTGLNVQDLDVDGHTNLDNVSVVGVTTFTKVGATAVFNSGAASDGRLEFKYNNSRVGLLAYHSNRLEIQTDSSKDFTIRTNGANERLRIDSSGRLLLGHTSDIGYGFRSQLVGTDGNTSSSSQIRFTASASGSTYVMAKSRNGTPGSKTIVQDDDNLGEIQWRGDDGVDYLSIAASIKAEVDGTPGAGDMPGRLVFGTTADGAESATERLRLTSDGRLLLNTTAVTNTNDVLTVKRATGSFTAMSMTVDASTAAGDYCNALIYTKSKGTYWNGLGFQTTHGHIGAIVGKRDSAGGDSDQEIRIEIGGTDINQSEEKTWNFKNNGDLSISGGNLNLADGKGFYTSSTARILIDTEGSGDIYLGGASTADAIGNSNSRGFVYDNDGGSNHPYLCMQHASKSGGNPMYIAFQCEGSIRGSIKENTLGTEVSYNTTSDYRLKQDELLISDGISKVKQLKPYYYKWKENVEHGYCQGFFAHEVADIVKGAVNGTKDEIATQEGIDNGTYLGSYQAGDPVHQSMDYSRLTPLLTAALKEAITKIETLETKVAALESS